MSLSFAARPLRSTPSKQASRGRRIIVVFVVLLALVLLGTAIVLSTVRYYFVIPKDAFLTEAEVPWHPEDAIKQLLDREEDTVDELKRRGSVEWEEFDGGATATGTALIPIQTLEPVEVVNADLTAIEEWDIDGKGSGGYWMRKDWDGRVQDLDSWDRLYNVSILPGEKMPRIIHQTWKSDTLPEKWRKSWRECREGMPDYTYMLWTDELSRKFVAQHYPEQLEMFDSYRYPIQRADSIRYFILDHFGGIYMDLDIGCRRRMDLLLQGDWEVLLPVTKPVGVSNDLLVAKPKSGFFAQTIQALKKWDHQYVTNYPTVMFSTGPMMLSAQFSIYAAAHPVTPEDPHAHVRIMPTSLYGKNAPKESVPHSFFSHFYGSSWHADDAGFITWLGRWGRNLLIVGVIVLILGSIRILWSKVAQAGGIRAFLGGRSQQYQLLPVVGGTESEGASPTGSFGSGPLSPTFEVPPDIGGALRRAGNMILAAPATLLNGGRRQRGWLFFTPTAFQPGHGRRRTASEASQMPLRRRDDRRAPPPLSDVPPPYESDASEGMDEVDAFLKDADGEERPSERV